ncbi:hypothetical protein M426DRAFT_112773 [Hypoxylon sp. CI-4A]|nr:hypothetical protein M426DRAFT_112773 [Hypoxylon sp. CI-4A]
MLHTRESILHGNMWSRAHDSMSTAGWATERDLWRHLVAGICLRRADKIHSIICQSYSDEIGWIAGYLMTCVLGAGWLADRTNIQQPQELMLLVIFSIVSKIRHPDMMTSLSRFLFLFLIMQLLPLPFLRE